MLPFARKTDSANKERNHTLTWPETVARRLPADPELAGPPFLNPASAAEPTPRVADSGRCAGYALPRYHLIVNHLCSQEIISCFN